MRLLDVTLRDGGFLNDFALSRENVRWILALLDSAELDCIEIGYLTGLPANHGDYHKPGICFSWQPEEIAEATAKCETPLVGMLHPGGKEPLDLAGLASSNLAFVRVPITPGADAGWRALAERLASEGIGFTVNLTLASWASTEAVVESARQAEACGAAVFYVADTNSALLPDRVESLFRALSNAVQIPLGFHAHDCKRLALANVVAALRGNAIWVDCSLAGLGRGAGNAATEVVHEIAGRGHEARHRLLRALPAVTSSYGVECQTELWLELCAFMDLWPPTIDSLEKAEVRLGIDRYAAVADRVLGQRLDQPPNDKALWDLIGANSP